MFIYIWYHERVIIIIIITFVVIIIIIIIIIITFIIIIIGIITIVIIGIIIIIGIITIVIIIGVIIIIITIVIIGIIIGIIIIIIIIGIITIVIIIGIITIVIIIIGTIVIINIIINIIIVIIIIIIIIIIGIVIIIIIMGTLYLGFYSLSGKTSYRKISRKLDAVRLSFEIISLLWKLTGHWQQCCPGTCQISERSDHSKSIFFAASRLREVWRSEPRHDININIPSYRYRDPRVKDKTVSPTVLSLTWESPYLRKTVFILRRGSDVLQLIEASSFYTIVTQEKWYQIVYWNIMSYIYKYIFA